jgi:sortase A
MVLRAPWSPGEFWVAQGTTAAAMQAGAGHFVQSALPGEPGNIAVLGHTVSYGRPFHRLGQARVGESVRLAPFDFRTGGHGRWFTCRAVGPFDHHSNPWTVPAGGVAELVGRGATPPGRWLTLVTVPRHGMALVLRLVLV